MYSPLEVVHSLEDTHTRLVQGVNQVSLLMGSEEDVGRVANGIRSFDEVYL